MISLFSLYFYPYYFFFLSISFLIQTKHQCFTQPRERNVPRMTPQLPELHIPHYCEFRSLKGSITNILMIKKNCTNCPPLCLLPMRADKFTTITKKPNSTLKRVKHTKSQIGILVQKNSDEYRIIIQIKGESNLLKLLKDCKCCKAEAMLLDLQDQHFH